MPAKRELTMRQLRHLLRLHHEGVSAREIGRRLGVARSTIQDNLKRVASRASTITSSGTWQLQLVRRFSAIMCDVSATQIRIFTPAQNMHEIFMSIRVDLLPCPTPPWAHLPDLGRWRFRRPLFVGLLDF